MPRSAILYLGEFFAEAGAYAGAEVQAVRRWYLGKESVSKGFAAFLNSLGTEPVTEVLVSTKALQKTLNRRLGQTTAFLVTAGFEHWLEINRPVLQSFFTLHAERTPSLIEESLIFGVSERVGSDGRIEKPLEMADLEFLASKLKLHSVEQVAIGFMHSSVNAQHEQMAARYLSENGFQVTASHDYAGQHGEISRWWAAIMDIYLKSRLKSITEDIQTALTEAQMPDTPIRLMTTQGAVDIHRDKAALLSLFGPIYSLHKWRQSQRQQTLLFLGLEDHWILDGRWQESSVWRSPWGPVALEHPQFYRLNIQPTLPLQATFWNSIGLGEQEMGYEPGPMSLGKGVTPQLLDILSLRNRLPKIEGISERLSEKAMPRITEILGAIARSTGASTPIDLGELESSFAERLVWNLPQGSSEVCIGGPLAAAYKPTLEPILHRLGVQARWIEQKSMMMESLAAFGAGGEAEE